MMTDVYCGEWWGYLTMYCRTCGKVCNSVVAYTNICSVARSKELDILHLHDVGNAQFCVVMDTIYVITVVIVAVVPSLCFRSVERV